ncbi:hypothetical protein BO82DRAFT_1796 [Aspergillus uvarum CBS 121591]|uniref:Uncharacterized protein n=1 Tax=Aspergillus uvarum CBS 121591 TaxID=1448315 RepID=A0A319D7U6_9EURO|nr:hypothetical protein BO82DRAFT_1796 [Aspergillus uvarum CBS 121591]PYH87053.1 hypothetical protein BO82DRAFT_1796 [Aspergillus uvarum CBS 121591]
MNLLYSADDHRYRIGHTFPNLHPSHQTIRPLPASPANARHLKLPILHVTYTISP